MAKVDTTLKPLTIEEALAKISNQEGLISELEEKATKDAETIAELEAAVEESAKAYADLAKQLDGSLAKSEGFTFTIDKVKRKVIYPVFNYNGKNWKAEEIIKEQVLLKELVEMNFGGFEIVNE